jgi:hypothetical protein
MTKPLMMVIREGLGEHQHRVLQPSPLKRKSRPEIAMDAKKMSEGWVVTSMDGTRDSCSHVASSLE